jgi:hypothetical protein
MAVKHVVRPRKRCPLYCTIDHRHEGGQHSHLIAEVDVEKENAFLAVNLVRPDDADEIALAVGKGWGEPVVTTMTADEARELRDALNVAVAVLDRR